MRRAFAAALVVVASLAVVGAVQAALPPKGASFSFHDHETAGKNWHVEMKIDAGDRKKIRTLVVYSQQCRATIAKSGVPISDAGVVAASGGLVGGGTWAVTATFKESTTVVGTMRMTRADCDTGVLSFPNAITGDGHTDHEHAGGGHSGHGKKYADFDSASAHERRQAAALHRRVLKKWRGVSESDAQRLGFFRRMDLKRKPGIFHAYNKRYEADNRIFDARRPESLVFWRQSQGAPVMIGPMFRVPAGKRPRFGGPIPIYHNHKTPSGRRGRSQMTHVWMVGGPKMAWANCLPVKQLTMYNPAFKWKAGSSNHEHVGQPC